MSDLTVIIGDDYVGLPLAREATRSRLRVFAANHPRVSSLATAVVSCGPTPLSEDSGPDLNEIDRSELLRSSGLSFRDKEG
jgi:hypothetical protein